MSKDIKTNVCRMCMASNVVLVGIFDCINRNLAEDIQFCTGILVQKSDSFPKKICQDCVVQLKTAYLFKKKCLKTNKKFQILYSSKSEVKSTQIKIEGRNHLQTEMKKETPMHFLSMNVKQEKSEDVARNIKIEVEIEGDRLEVCKREMKEDEHKNEDYGDPSHKLEDMEQKNIVKSPKPVSKHVLSSKRKARRAGKETVCELCGTRVVGVHNIWKHAKMHKPPEFECGHCEYKTWFKGDFDNHSKIHLEKQYQCGYCSRMFYYKNNLNVHVRRIHENDGVKRFKCNMCDAHFMDGSSLKKHAENHLEARSFECEVCYSRFKTRNYWKEHMRKVHSITTPHQKRGRRRNTEFLQTTCDTELMSEAPPDS